MSKKGNLTREEAIAAVGIDAVVAVEAENCDFTNRVQTDGDTSVEFSACVVVGDEAVLRAYYYQEQAVVDAAEDLGGLNWEIAGYEIA